MTVAQVPGQTLTWVNHQNIVKQISHEVLLIILFFKSVFFLIKVQHTSKFIFQFSEIHCDHFH